MPDRRRWWAVGFAVSASVGLAAGGTARGGAGQAASAAGAFSAVQAERGKQLYEKNCSSCHGASLRGGANEFAAPALAGPFFFEKWRGRPVEELYRFTVENMPPDQSTLPEAAYVDITAYILQVLKYPSGDAELTAASPMMKGSIEPQQQR